jgi:hypothetical protein
MKEEILSWLQGPRIYLEGVRLYDQFGYNKALKNSFNKGNTKILEEMLALELSKLIGLTEEEFKNLPRFAKKSTKKEKQDAAPKKAYIDDLLIQLAEQFNLTVEEVFTTDNEIKATETQKAAIEKLSPEYNKIPETMKKVIRIREKYPFLKSQDCPDELKIMVADMFTAYDNYREAYALLSDKNSQTENLELARTVVENYLQNREMWEELDYFKEHGEILGKASIFELFNLRKKIQAMSDIDLTKELNNVKPNITKSKKAIKDAKDEEARAEAEKRLEKWLTTKKEIETELLKRKNV